jgi:hypothetical protein
MARRGICPVAPVQVPDAFTWPAAEPSGYADPDMPIPADAWGAPEQTIEDRVEPGAFAGPAPIYTGSNPGPWFHAAFPGICEKGGEGFEKGDTIRADGQGGYECHGCVTDEIIKAQPPAPTAWERPTAANVKLPKPTPAPVADAFTAPAPVSDRPAKQRTDRNGHRLKDPVLGDFRRYKNGEIKSVQRVTTFNKAVEDKAGLTNWMKVNVLVGAAARPEVSADAHGKTWDTHKKELLGLVKILEEAAGSKKAADTGTLIHKLCERWDKGEVTLDQVPPAFRPFVVLYRDALKESGLRAVAGMQELTTFIEEWGGVSGSFDNVYEHVATGAYYIGDIKTGKTMDYGWDPIECQEAIYAHGYNRFGTYDWDDEVWLPPKLRVSEEWGIVIHLPTKGDHVGTCRVLAADLTRGWDYAAECGSVKARRSLNPKPIPFASLVPAQAPIERDWSAEFSCVTHRDQAGVLWQAAKDAGVDPMELNRLVQLAQSTLRAAGVSG